MTQYTRYQLEKIANITKAEEILNDFRELKVLGQNVKLDASQVERIDTSVLQLIVSLKKSLKEQELELDIENANQVVTNAACICGLNKILSIN